MFSGHASLYADEQGCARFCCLSLCLLSCWFLTVVEGGRSKGRCRSWTSEKEENPESLWEICLHSLELSIPIFPAIHSTKIE